MSDSNNVTAVGNNESTASASSSALAMAEEDEVIMSLIQIVARVGSLLSVIGSCYILFNLVGNKRKRNKNLRSSFNRLLVALCISDVIGSLAMFIGNWAVPTSPSCEFEGEDSQEIWDIYFPGATGNSDTCIVQGFFVQVGVVGSALFTCFITVQTVLLVVFQCREAFMKRAETAFFALGILTPLATAICAAAAGLLFPVMSGYCWIAHFEFPVYMLFKYPPHEENCSAELLRFNSVGRPTKFARTFVLLLGWIGVILVTIVTSMVILFRFVRKQERQASRWSQNARQGQRQKQVLSKALMYGFMYALVWGPALRSAFGIGGVSLGFHLSAAMVLPLQGFLNSLVYAGIVDKILRKLCCCCCTWCLATAPTGEIDSSAFVSGSGGRPFTNSNQSMDSVAPDNQESVEAKMTQYNKDKFPQTAKLSESERQTDEECAQNSASRPSEGITLANIRNMTAANYTPCLTNSNEEMED